MPAKIRQQPPMQMYPDFRLSLSCSGASFELATEVGLATTVIAVNDCIKCVGSLPWRFNDLHRQRHEATKQSVAMLPQIHAINAPSVKQGLLSAQCWLADVLFTPPPMQRESCADASTARGEVVKHSRRAPAAPYRRRHASEQSGGRVRVIRAEPLLRRTGWRAGHTAEAAESCCAVQAGAPVIPLRQQSPVAQYRLARRS